MNSGFLITCKSNKGEESKDELIDLLYSIAYSPKLVQSPKDLKIPLNINNCFPLKYKIIDIKYIKSLYLLKTSINSLELFRNINSKLNYTFKILPLHKIVHLNQLKYIINECLMTIEKNDQTYKIIYDQKNCKLNLKNEVYELIVPNLEMKVNLSNPDWLFIVQVFNNEVGVSFLKNQNFNFNEN